MKTGTAVVGVHIAVLCAFSLTQGCLTTSSDNNRSSARLKGPFHHEHKGKTPAAVAMIPPTPVDMGGMGIDNGPLYPVDPVVSVPIEPMTSIPPSTTETYIVRKGDTISQLAVDFDTTSAELVRLNNLANPDVLYVGQELAVPAGRGNGASQTRNTSSSSIKKGGTYVIQKGDTLSEIAIAAGVSIDALRKLNNIQGDMIRAGETLDIPAGGKVPSTMKKSTPKKVAPQSVPKMETKVEEPAPAVTELALPEMAPAVDEVPEATAPSSFDVIEERVLYPGETLDDIAREYGVSKAEIMRLNGIIDENEVPSGKRLKIPISE